MDTSDRVLGSEDVPGVRPATRASHPGGPRDLSNIGERSDDALAQFKFMQKEELG